MRNECVLCIEFITHGAGLLSLKLIVRSDTAHEGLLLTHGLRSSQKTDNKKNGRKG